VLKVQSDLSEDLEDLIYRTIGCCIAVHRALGPGFLERIYLRALCLELAHEKIAFEAQKSYPVVYRGEVLSQQRLDLVVASQLVLEIKSVEQLHPIYRQQLLSYLAATRIRAGLLVNFNVVVLQDGLKRVVL
jgi:GxxExxY protein